VAAGVVNQVLCQLFGGSHSKVGGIAAADRSRVVEVEHRTGKIRAIVKEEVEVAARLEGAATSAPVKDYEDGLASPALRI
jgi:hypothetical protein